MAIRPRPNHRTRKPPAPRAPWYLLRMTPSIEADPEGFFDVVLLTPPEENDLFVITLTPRDEDPTELAAIMRERLDDVPDDIRPQSLLVVPAALAEELRATGGLDEVELTPAEADAPLRDFMQAHADALVADALRGDLLGVDRRHREVATLAARVYHLNPWTLFAEQELFRFSGDGIADTFNLALVLGAEEEGAEGIVFYAGEEDLWAQLAPPGRVAAPCQSIVLLWGEDDPEMNLRGLMARWGLPADGIVPMLQRFNDAEGAGGEDDEVPGAPITDPALLDHLLACLEAMALLMERAPEEDDDEDDDEGATEALPLTLADGRTVRVEVLDVYELDGAEERLQMPDLTEALGSLDGYFDEELEYDLRLAGIPARFVKASAWDALNVDPPEDPALVLPAVVFYIPRQAAKPYLDRLRAIRGFATLFDGVSGLYLLAMLRPDAPPAVLDVLEVEDQDELDDMMETFEEAEAIGLLALVFAEPGPGQEAPLRERDIHLAWPVPIVRASPGMLPTPEE